MHFCGVQRKIKKAEYRDGYVSTINNFAGNIRIQTFAESFADLFQAPSPSTPEGVIICTPVSPGMRLEWNTSLPWLRFRELVRPDISQSMTLNNYRFLFSLGFYLSELSFSSQPQPLRRHRLRCHHPETLEYPLGLSAGNSCNDWPLYYRGPSSTTLRTYTVTPEPQQR